VCVQEPCVYLLSVASVVIRNTTYMSLPQQLYWFTSQAYVQAQFLCCCTVPFPSRCTYSVPQPLYIFSSPATVNIQIPSIFAAPLLRCCTVHVQFPCCCTGPVPQLLYPALQLLYLFCFASCCTCQFSSCYTDPSLQLMYTFSYVRIQFPSCRICLVP
jgi:hypothetical protein